MSDERIKRPNASRTQPIRNWSTLFPAGTREPENGTANGNGRPEAPEGNVVARSVELGYRIIDDYIRQGQKVAQRVGDRSYDAAGMTTDAQDVATRMTQYASQFTMLWMDALQSAAGTVPGTTPPWNVFGPNANAPQPTPPPQRTAAPDAAPSDPLRVRLRVGTSVPTEVSLDLRPECAPDRMTVHALRAAAPDGPRISDVVIEAPRDDAPLTICIRVPAGHPAGDYVAAITDTETARPVGTIHVRVAPS